jgi:hypothetical protein
MGQVGGTVHPLDPSLTVQVADAWLPLATGATQLVDLLVGNPRRPVFLAILDTTFDAAAMSVRD